MGAGRREVAMATVMSRPSWLPETRRKYRYLMIAQRQPLCSRACALRDVGTTSWLKSDLLDGVVHRDAVKNPSTQALLSEIERVSWGTLSALLYFFD